MAVTITEWEYTADVASWINQILGRDPRTPFSEAKCEQRTSGSLKRRDLTLLDRDKRIVLTGEVKLPYQADGGSPYNEEVVQDARKKAGRAKSDYFFTWNINQCVLWETFPLKTARRVRKYKSWSVTNISRANHLMHPMTVKDVKNWLPVFLEDFENILRGKISIGLQSPDEQFIEALESSLRMPINLALEDLVQKYEDRRFKIRLDKWMTEDQGWLISEDQKDIRDNLERASKFSCYALVNKLVFYEVMLKRYSSRLDKLIVPAHIDTGDSLRLLLESYFFNAKEETGDYETVFGEDYKEVGNLIPFYSDSAVVHWRELINQIHQFDFSKLDYEVIGNIFERLISPEERHKYGQYYTRPEVVDLINSFCILRGDERILDPASGGGTFLVRAYVRKRNLLPGRKHRELLSDIYGIDISHFATHLTTINLTTRDLIDEDNYPQIARSDFFDVIHDKPFLQLPNHSSGVKVKTKGMGKRQQREVEIPLLDAVIGNPPYVRQEDIRRSKNKDKPERGTKEQYMNLVTNEWPDINLSGRSDLHCYFWPHAATFLKEDGYLCLLTSSQWLDVEYGFRLQEWILKNFEILAIFESVVEPWFIGARVVTAVAILHRQLDESARMNNVVRFVQLRCPLRDLLLRNGTPTSELISADEFRDEILSIKKNTVSDRYRVRLVRQGDLWEEGVRLGLTFQNSQVSDGEKGYNLEIGRYFGGKWGVYLRAPDFWFEIIDSWGKKFAPLGEIAEVRRGITTGKDCFFLPKDVSSEVLSETPDPEIFERTYGISRNAIESGKLRLVRCGEKRGELRPIETEYLEPEIHSLMEISGYSVSAKDCNRSILQLKKGKKQLIGTRALKYIEWGEQKGWHKGSTCSARVSRDRAWYDLTGHRSAPALWPKERQYRHIAPSNDARLIANCRLYEIFPPDDLDSPDLCAAILNSSWTLFSSLQFGRPVGNEGNWSTMVVDVNMMLVPDPRRVASRQLRNVATAFRKMRNRKAISFLSERRLRQMAYTQAGKSDQLDKLSDLCELDMKDRKELDDAVLQMIGVSSKKRREELIEQLYDYLRDYFEKTRQKEEKAIENKKRAKRRGPARPMEIAAQILSEIREREPDQLLKYSTDFIGTEKPFDVFELPEIGEPHIYSNMFIRHGVHFKKGKKGIKIIETRNTCQASLVYLVARTGYRGLVRFPFEAPECERVFKAYQEFIHEREKRLMKLIAERTADEEMQSKILEALLLLLKS